MARLSIEVIRAWRDRQDVVLVELAEGSTALDAALASGLTTGPPGTAAEPILGIFGRRVPGDTALKDGDRVEVYRQLVLDAMEARRAKASAKRRLKR